MIFWEFYIIFESFEEPISDTCRIVVDQGMLRLSPMHAPRSKNELRLKRGSARQTRQMTGDWFEIKRNNARNWKKGWAHLQEECNEANEQIHTVPYFVTDSAGFILLTIPDSPQLSDRQISGQKRQPAKYRAMHASRDYVEDPDVPSACTA